jgi:uncharacterized protein
MRQLLTDKLWRGLRMSGTWAIMLALVAVVAVGSGCQFQQHREGLARLHAAGDYSGALRELEGAKGSGLYGEGDQLVYLLDRGALMLQQGRDEEVIATLEQAEAIMDLSGKQNEGDVILQWLVNDTAAKYVGEPYEDIYVNTFKLLAQLRRGEIRGGATVEARRAAGKIDVLRGRFAQANEALSQKKKEQGLPGDGARGVVDETTQGQFVDSPLTTYLTAVTFMKAGDTGLQQVAARRLETAINAQQQIIGPVDAGAFSQLGAISGADANVLLVAFSGTGPTKVAQRVGPIPLGDIPIYFELPQLVSRPSNVERVVAKIESGGQVQEVELNLVERLSGVATENHRRQLGQIYARTLIRAAIKSGISWGITESVRRNQSGPRRRGNEEAVVAVLGGLAALALTERADVRCWAMLPGQSHVALASVPAGDAKVTIEYRGAGGSVVASEVFTTKAPAGASELATIIAHTAR